MADWSDGSEDEIKRLRSALEEKWNRAANAKQERDAGWRRK